MLAIGAASLLAWVASQVAPEDAWRYPAAVDLVKDQMSAACPKASRNVDFTDPVMIWVTDFNGDGIQDYVVSEQHVTCSRWGVGDRAAGIHKCRRSCRVWLILSSGRDSYRLAWSGRAFNMVRSGHDTLAAETRYGCRSMTCTFSLIWQDGAVVRKPGIR